MSSRSSHTWATIFKVAVVGGVFTWLTVGIILKPASLRDWHLFFWLIMIAAVELMPVPAWRGLRFSLSLPVILAVAILYDPVAAGCLLFVGLFDSRELRREMPLVN